MEKKSGSITRLQIDCMSNYLAVSFTYVRRVVYISSFSLPKYHYQKASGHTCFHYLIRSYTPWGGTFSFYQ